MGGSGYGYHTTTVIHHERELSIKAIVMITLLVLLLVVCVCAYCQSKSQEKDFNIEKTRAIRTQKREEIKTEVLFTRAGDHDESFENTNFQFHPDGSVTEQKVTKTVKYEPQETEATQGSYR